MSSIVEHPLLILGMETSTFSGSIALLDACEVHTFEHQDVHVDERSLDPNGRRHARTLVPEIQSMLTAAARTAGDIDLIAVGIGPGSFTGLRVGVVCAKTLAWAVGAKLVGIDTFLAIAVQSPADVERVQVVGDGQRGDLYVGRYVRNSAGDWSRDGEIDIAPAEEWLSGLAEGDVVSGPGLERHAEAAAARCRVLPRDLWTPRASSIATLGALRALTGKTDDIWSLEPFYLRKSGAEETADAASRV